MTTHDAFIGLGANIAPRRANIYSAINQLDQFDSTRCIACSLIRETEPVGLIQDQPMFLNAVVRLRTSLRPSALLACMFEIERAHGRDRSVEQRWGPRTLDLDLLLYDDLCIRDQDLVIPHPRLTGRRFVLEPLADLIPDQIIPGTTLTVIEHLQALAISGASV